MRIHVLSDLHLEFAPLDVEDLAVDLVVLAGDIAIGADAIAWAAATFDRPVIYIAGNHEFYGHRVEAVSAACRQEAAETPHVRLCVQLRLVCSAGG